MKAQVVSSYDGNRSYNGLFVHGDAAAWAVYRVILKQPITNDQAAMLRQTLAAFAPARCHLASLEYQSVAIRYNNTAIHDGSYNHGSSLIMGNLNETEKWEENIYQLETSDPVLGGADGISNRAPRQLANRTKWLKKKTEEAAQSLAEHVRSRNHPDATLTAKGFTQLSSATNSTSETLAATPKAVKAAYDLAAGKAPASHTHPWSQITGVPAASLTAKGTVQLSSATDSQSETEAATPKAVKAAYDLAAGKAPVSHTHPWSQITGVPAASLTAKGTVQLSSAINSTSEILAATPKAVKAAYDLANGKQPADATLTALAGLATAADRFALFYREQTAQSWQPLQLLVALLSLRAVIKRCPQLPCFRRRLGATRLVCLFRGPPPHRQQAG
ncbi:Putative tail fiber protein [Escherichia coli]|nr:Putative tail fiber protein [Escherichia coli]